MNLLTHFSISLQDGIGSLTVRSALACCCVHPQDSTSAWMASEPGVIKDGNMFNIDTE
jgi:hypothetical protein